MFGVVCYDWVVCGDIYWDWVFGMVVDVCVDGCVVFVFEVDLIFGLELMY